MSDDNVKPMVALAMRLDRLEVENFHLKDENGRLKKILYSYRTYYKAAMRATSLGLCKRVIKHATEDDQKISNGG